MTGIPAAVTESFGIREVGLRRFRFPYFEAYCNNCSWLSFTYASEEEAIDRAGSHSERCTRYLNEMRALEVEVNPVEAQDLEHGARVLLRDLRTMDIENVEVFDDEVMLTYSIDSLESQILMLRVGHVVKVVA